MFDKEIFRHFANELWDKVQSFFLLKQEAYNGILVEQSWKTVACVQGNTEIALPSLENVEEISVEMYHADGTIVHQATVRVDNLLYESTNTTHREILLDSIHNSQTFVTYNMETNSISPSYCEGEEVSNLVTTTVRIKETLETGTTNLIASRIKYNGENSGLESDNVNGAIDEVLSTSKEYTDTKVADLVGSAPETLDTLEELAQALDENEDVVTALNSAIGTKANTSDLTGHTSNTNNPHSVTKSQVGLSEVDNTSDLNKPISTATQNALNAKANITYVNSRETAILQNIKTNINDNIFEIKTVNKDGIEVAANGTTDEQIFTNLEANERLIGLAGYNVSNASEDGWGGSYGTIYKTYPDNDGETYNVSIRNLNTSKGLTIRVYLYLIVAKNLD